MSPNRTVTALIAEDEPLLAAALKAALARAWPELRIVATVGDGVSAVAQALQLQPDVLFFDIQMPGLNGLDAAAELADAWPYPGADGGPASKPFPALVFVTAYDHYAVQAFEAQAVDYLLKPVQDARLQKTVSKVQLRQQIRGSAAINSEANKAYTSDMEHTLNQLRALLAGKSALPAAGALRTAPLQMIQAAQTGPVGNGIRMVPMADVLYLEAADKYIRVFTADAEYLIRTPLKDLLPQLDANTFWQVHRGTLVRASAIDTVVRDESGRLTISLHGRADKLGVSRLYAHLFKAM
jgi:DNA-binding LytR/AlgR family response regulator